MPDEHHRPGTDRLAHLERCPRDVPLGERRLVVVRHVDHDHVVAPLRAGRPAGAPGRRADQRAVGEDERGDGIAVGGVIAASLP